MFSILIILWVVCVERLSPLIGAYLRAVLATLFVVIAVLAPEFMTDLIIADIKFAVEFTKQAYYTIKSNWA